MDICTLVIVTTINTIGCAKAEECFIKNNRKLCVPFHAVACPIPEPYYECKKEDGSQYMLKQSEIK